MLAEQLPDAEGTLAEQLKRIEDWQEEHEKSSKNCTRSWRELKRKMMMNAEFHLPPDKELMLVKMEKEEQRRRSSSSSSSSSKYRAI